MEEKRREAPTTNRTMTAIKVVSRDTQAQTTERLTCTLSQRSLLHRLRSPRPPRSPPSRRAEEGLGLHCRRCLPLFRHLRYHARLRQAPSCHHDQGVARGYQRVPQGASAHIGSLLENRSTNTYITNTQAQKSDPLTGLTSEGYNGKGHVQSPSASA